MNRLDYLLSKLGEEASEVAQIALKAQQFGLENEYPVGGETTAQRLRGELVDLMSVVWMLGNEFGFDFKVGEDQVSIDKMTKVEKWYNVARSNRQESVWDPEEQTAEENRMDIIGQNGNDGEHYLPEIGSEWHRVGSRNSMGYVVLSAEAAGVTYRSGVGGRPYNLIAPGEGTPWGLTPTLVTLEFWLRNFTPKIGNDGEHCFPESGSEWLPVGHYFGPVHTVVVMTGAGGDTPQVHAVYRDDSPDLKSITQPLGAWLENFTPRTGK